MRIRWRLVLPLVWLLLFGWGSYESVRWRPASSRYFWWSSNSTGYHALEELDFTLQKRNWRLQRMGAGIHGGRFWLASEPAFPVSVPRVLGGPLCCPRFFADQC